MPKKFNPITHLSRVPFPVRIGLLVVFLIIFPLFLNSYWTHILAYIGLHVVLGMGLNVVVGFAGLLDLGYVAFYAVGAYLYALLASPKFGIHLPFWLMLPSSMIIAALMGILLGIPVLRMRGDYLAIVTLGFGEIIRLIINNLDPITGGPQGIWRIDPPKIFSFVLTSPWHFYYLTVAGCFFAYLIADRLNNSRIGRAWIAIREDEEAAGAMGIDRIKYKLLAFAIGASFAGLGGTIFAARQGSIFPADFSLMVSINVLCLIIIGGMGSIPGVVIGSVILIGLPEVLRSAQQYRLLIFGALLVAMMIFRPAGFIPASRRKMEFEEEKPHGNL